MGIKKKVIFGITSLTLGGAERVLVDVANSLAGMYDITIFCIYDNGKLKKELAESVKFRSLYKCKREQLSAIKKKLAVVKIFLFKKHIYNKFIKGKYDVEIAFLEGPITRLFSVYGKSKKIAWVHNDINNVFGKGVKSKLKRIFDKNTYSRYSNIVFVSQDNMESFKNCYHEISAQKMRLIRNYINENLVINKANMKKNVFKNDREKKMLTVCRLVQQKAIDRLIKIHSRLISNGYIHKFYVIGDGPERAKLEQIIKDENVTDSFILMGEKENPYPYIKEADYFCLLSYFEGYGMVIEEAKILNKKIIITNTAAKECVAGYNNCVILENEEQAIYDGIVSSVFEEKNIDNVSYYKNTNSLTDYINIIGE